MKRDWICVGLLGASCGQQATGPAFRAPADSATVPMVDTVGADGDGGETGPEVDTGAGRTGPQWLSWAGTDVLTVDVFADGDAECVFRWNTTGLHVLEPCEGCDFEFEVTAVIDPASSTCAGGVQDFDRRWWRSGRLYREALTFDESSLESGALVARSYRLDIDEAYGAVVATTLEVAATLR